MRVSPAEPTYGSLRSTIFSNGPYSVMDSWLSGGPSEVLSETEYTDLWANTAAHSHNGYLDIALTTGFPGLFLCVAFVVIGPIISYHRYSRNRSSRVAPEMTALSTFLLQIWLFGIYFNCFESALFDRGNSVWFFLCSAVFGLYYISRFPLLNELPPFEGNLPVRNKRRITS